MKFIKIKSLAVKIWITYAIIILIVLSSSSIIYLCVFRNLEEKDKIESLSLAHDILLRDSNSNNTDNSFNKMKNLQGSKHFILDISINNEIYVNDIRQKEDNYHEPNEDSLRGWMAKFIQDDDIYEKQFKSSYDNYKVIFIISSIKSTSIGKSYLISYIKDNNDNDLENIMIGIVIFFIILGIILAKIVANVISKPVKELEAFTREIANKNWSEPIKVSSKDEIGNLAAAMNEMQRELKKANEEEKIFFQSISHGLKTPVMVIMSHAEAIIDGIYVESVESTAEIIKNEAVNLEKKINQILYLNTLDYVLKNNNKNAEINLCKLLLSTIKRFKLINSKIIWKIEADETFIYGNLEKIEVVFENILDNQLRYAKETIKVSLKPKDIYAEIEIYNDGSKINENHIEHIFDNMYKDKTGNFGIGLAVCKKIIEFYQGEIFAINRELGVSFIIKLPYE